MLAVAVDIRDWLRNDRLTSYAKRLERDREIGRSLPEGSDEERILAWWSAVSPDGGVGARLERLRRAATVALFAVGVLFGIAAAGVSFGYSGDHPVNLIALLGVLVGVPFVLLLITIILLLGRAPGLGAARDAFAGVSPARWVGAWLDRMGDTEIFAAFASSGAATGFARWQLTVFSQWFAVGFFVGVLITAWLLVAFTDLAFGWSTTLQIDARHVERGFSALAIPWSAWMPAAVPDPSLVEASHYYRLEKSTMPASRVMELGRWWPFVVMSIAVYGVLPRAGLLAFAAWRLKRATHTLLREDPEVTALLNRLNAPRVSFEGESEPTQTTSGDSLPAPGAVPKDSATAVLVWNRAASQTQVERFVSARLGVAPAQSFQLSAMQDEAERRRLLEQVAKNVRQVVIFTKGWEPPLLEFSDFLAALREVLGLDATVVIAPVTVNGSAVNARDRDVWAGTLARQRDSRLYVAEADLPEDCS